MTKGSKVYKVLKVRQDLLVNPVLQVKEDLVAFLVL